ncbi:MAG: hypothetical protein WBA91_03100 [Paracoccaceae bacterium]
MVLAYKWFGNRPDHSGLFHLLPLYVSRLREVPAGSDRLENSGMTDAETRYRVLTGATEMQHVLFDAVTDQPEGRWSLSPQVAGN